MPRPFELPAELIDQTFEHLWDDKRTLSSSSLVCRSWLTGSRRVLFYHVTVYISRTPLYLFAEFVASTSGSPGGGDHVDADTTGSLGGPAAHIRRLSIRGSPVSSEGDRSTYLLPCPMRSLGIIISSLPSLTYLELQEVELIGEMRLSAGPPRLQELDIVSTYTASHTEGELLHFIRQLPALLSLKIYHKDWTSFSLITPAGNALSLGDEGFPANISSLRSLTVRQKDLSRYFLDIIALAPPKDTLKSLEVSVCRSTDLASIGKLLDQLGHNLTHFGLELSQLLARCPMTNEVDLDQMHLRALTSLKSISFYFDFVSGPWASLPFNSTMLRTISYILSTPTVHDRIETITFHIWIDGGVTHEDQILKPLLTRLEDQFAWLERAPETMSRLCEIKWVWLGLEKQAGMTEEQRSELGGSLDGVVRLCYPGLSGRGLLRLGTCQ